MLISPRDAINAVVEKKVNETYFYIPAHQTIYTVLVDLWNANHGIDLITFESDYPHQDSTWPNTMDVVAEIAARVTPEELEMLVRTNAIEMLHLDPADLRPVVSR